MRVDLWSYCLTVDPKSFRVMNAEICTEEILHRQLGVTARLHVHCHTHTHTQTRASRAVMEPLLKATGVTHYTNKQQIH